MSNYPAGVTGNEYEISGAEYSNSGKHLCDNCNEQLEEDEEETVHDGQFEGHRDRGAWFICDDCGETTELEGEDEGYSAAHEAADEARAEWRRESADRHYDD